MSGTGSWFRAYYHTLRKIMPRIFQWMILTEKFHVSRTYISRLLKKYAGKSFLEYLTDVRFKHVEKLIADDRYKQYEIAEMVGYKDFGYYIKVFKKRYGITPNEFRKHI